MPKKHTYEYIESYLDSLGYILISKEYFGTRFPLRFMDKEGYYYLAMFDNLRGGAVPDKFNKSNPYTIQNIKLWCRLNNKPFELLNEKYESSAIKLQWQCLKVECKEIFDMAWNDVIADCECSFCTGKRIGISNCFATKYPDIAKEWHPTKNGDLTPCDVTCSGKHIIWWQCEKGHEWQDRVRNRIKYIKCPFCNHQRYSKDYNLLACNPELCEEWDYEKNKINPEECLPNSHKKAWWKCKDCGHEWKTALLHRNRKNSGCPECNKSKGEKRIKTILDLKHIFYISQKEFAELQGLGGKNLSYDFYLSQYNLLIEYQGEQHEKYIKGFHKSNKKFERQQEHDKRKREYANNNNIRFLEIWYWDFDNIEEILLKAI
jgi:hypothetical protein